MSKTYDFVVVGAGVFGAWIAHSLRQMRARVALVDAYGAADSRSSSGGETRIIRMGYGPDELYTRWSARSLPIWKDLFRRRRVELFHQTGVLWLSAGGDAYTDAMLDVLTKCGIAAEQLSAVEIAKRYPQFSFSDIQSGVLELESGVLMARQAVQLVVKDAVMEGVEVFLAAVEPPRSTGRLTQVQMFPEGPISGGVFVFACGAWLAKLFPGLLTGRIRSTRQEVFFLGTPPGDLSFRVGQMPVWLHHSHPDRPYVLPDIENRGVKIAFDRHGPEIDPDTVARVVEQNTIDQLRTFLLNHVPALRHAPIVESRVCQYENTSNGDFLIDRHPEFDNVWVAGGGSGHGFKHGPAVGEYVCARILDSARAEPRFSLETKQTERLRSVY